MKNVMNRHLFRFMDKSYNQDEGGSIGSELTCVVAKVRMILWVRKLKERCLVIGLKVIVSCVYVDDSFFVVEKLRKGLRYDGRSLVVDEEQEERDRHLQDDVRMSELLVSVANYIEEDIQMMFDCHSRNPERKMPVLDLWICHGDRT